MHLRTRHRSKYSSSSSNVHPSIGRLNYSARSFRDEIKSRVTLKHCPAEFYSLPSTTGINRPPANCRHESFLPASHLTCRGGVEFAVSPSPSTNWSSSVGRFNIEHRSLADSTLRSPPPAEPAAIAFVHLFRVATRLTTIGATRGSLDKRMDEGDAPGGKGTGRRHTGDERKEASTGSRDTVRSGVALQVSWEITLCSICREPLPPCRGAAPRRRRPTSRRALFLRHVPARLPSPSRSPSAAAASPAPETSYVII